MFRGKIPHSATALLGAAVICGYAITGPIYTSLGYNGDAAVESAGIMVNQMARVVALDGDMSADDREYMSALFPVDRYTSTYAPCIVDNLKWDPDFNKAVLGSGMFQHYISMGIRNPRVYFEAWELETAGFWAFAVRGEGIYLASGNISAGVPRNVSTEYGIPDDYSISVQSKLPTAVRDFLPMDEWSIPAGWILWFMVFVGICLVGAKRARWVLLLVPGMVLLLTLVIASPIIYWPRYAFACQLLLPVYIGILWRIRQMRCESVRDSHCLRDDVSAEQRAR